MLKWYSKMKILTTTIEGNPNVGLYGFCNDKFCLLGKNIPGNLVKKIEKTLKVPVHQIQLCGTNLIGVFCAGNNEKIIVPDICFKHELKELDKLKINYETIKTKNTALGNLILCNDNAAVVSSVFSADTKKEIRQKLNLKVVPLDLDEYEAVGSIAVLRNNNGVCMRNIKKKDMNKIEDVLEVNLTLGTVNFGSMFIKSGVLTNSNGMVVGENSTGIELGILDEGLGFLDD